MKLYSKFLILFLLVVNALSAQQPITSARIEFVFVSKNVDEMLLNKLKDKGVESAFVTLHVGAGTFQPVRSEQIEDHEMHYEYLVVPQQTVDKCQHTRQYGGIRSFLTVRRVCV